MNNQFKQGDKVWVKVFSNYSYGTYIAFEEAKGKHLVRGDDDYFYSSSNILEEKEYPNEFSLIPKNWKEECEKCKNPYYFATKYLRIDGKPFTTYLNEEQFNKIIEKYETINK